MRLRRLGGLAAFLLATACFEENKPVDTMPGMDGTASDSDGTGTGTGPGATVTGPVTDTDPPPTTTLPPTSTSLDDTATSSESTTTGEPIPIECGDGIPAPGELCFEDTTVLMANDLAYSARIGDVSGTPAADVVYLISDQVVVRVGDGSGNFGPAVFDASLMARRFELADFDDDDELDMAVVETSGLLQLLRGTGAGSFMSVDQAATDSDPEALAVDDLDGNGALDVAVGSGTSVYTALGDGAGSLAPGPSFSSIGAVMGAAVADFDQNGTADLVLSIDGGGWDGVALRRGVGDGSFQEQEATPGTMPDARGLATGDFDGDGVSDVAYVSETMDALGVLLGTGGGGFRSELVAPTGSGPLVLHADDLDGDGRSELVVGHQGEAMLRIFTMSPELGLTEGLKLSLATTVTALHSGEVNGDGVPDLVATSTSAQIITVVLSTP